MGSEMCIRDRSKHLLRICQEVLDGYDLPALAIGHGSLWQIVFIAKEPSDYSEFIQADMASTRELDLLQMHNGLYVLPAVRRFVSAVHTDQDFEDTVKALDASCKTMVTGN